MYRSKSIFGDGRDGSIAYSVANSRWEDGNGNALSNGTKWTGVSTTTLVILKECLFQNVTIPSGATLQLGADGGYGLAMLHISGTLTLNGSITAGTYGVIGSASAPNGGAAKSTAGVGNAAAIVLSYLKHGMHGAGGGGGGDGTNAGGSRSVIAGIATQASIANSLTTQGSSASAGTTAAGVDGLVPTEMSSIVTQFDSPWMFLGSACGIGGSGGALKQAGGSNKGGAGGTGGAGKLPIRIRVNRLITAASAVINNAGGNGTAGEDGVASNASGDISGGGGGGGGGAGGAIGIEYDTWTDSGATISAAGGTGAAGGLGKEYNNVNRATSNGGAGAKGTDGIIVTQKYTG